MADMQIAVWFGREAGLDGGIFAALQVFFDNGTDKVVIRELVFV